MSARISKKNLETWADFLLEYSLGGVRSDDRVMLKGEPITWPLLSVLQDKIFRALGVLRNARLISSEEMLYMISYVRLGIQLSQVTGVSLDAVNRICQLTQPAHLQYLAHKQLDPAARDEARAAFIRRELA